MSDNPTVLEEGLNTGEGRPHEFENASIGQRFLNYIVDLVFFYVIAFVLGVVVTLSGTDPGVIESPWATVAFYVIWLIYYFIMELNYGKTFGKMLTRTRVVMDDGTPLTSKAIFVRTVSRLVPFEALSIFFGKGSMWHDTWANTEVVKNA